MKRVGWFLFVFFALGVGLYPFSYLLTDNIEKFGLLSQKAELIKSDPTWRFIFNLHISLGGLALFVGWPQFIKRLRNRYLRFHRNLGKLYVISVLLSGMAGIYIAYFAEGGWVAKAGFLGLGIGWLYTTICAYTTVKNGMLSEHKKWMIRSYALTFAAVTLRIWLPLFQYGFGMDFISAYVIIAWLCWVPNVIWAEWKIRRLSI